MASQRTGGARRVRRFGDSRETTHVSGRNPWTPLALRIGIPCGRGKYSVQIAAPTRATPPSIGEGTKLRGIQAPRIVARCRRETRLALRTCPGSVDVNLSEVCAVTVGEFGRVTPRRSVARRRPSQGDLLAKRGRYNPRRLIASRTSRWSAVRFRRNDRHKRTAVRAIRDVP